MKAQLVQLIMKQIYDEAQKEIHTIKIIGDEISNTIERTMKNPLFF